MPDPQPLDITAEIRHLKPKWKNTDEIPSIGSRETRRENTASFDVVVTDARRSGEQFGLERSGFDLRSGAEPLAGLDADRAGYRAQMLDLVKNEVGAVETYLFMDQVRTEDQSDFNTAYARFAHCDFNLAYLDRMTRRLLERNGRTHDPDRSYAWFNTWQPFDNRVEQNPLCVLDVRSLGEGDIVDYRYTGYEESGALVAGPVYDPAHRWYYYPDMTTDEVLLTKQLDKRPGHTAQCPHTSIIDTTRSGELPPRRSIETRILAVFDD